MSVDRQATEMLRKRSRVVCYKQAEQVRDGSFSQNGRRVSLASSTTSIKGYHYSLVLQMWYCRPTTGERYNQINICVNWSITPVTLTTLIWFDEERDEER